jgi:carnitine O-acetyltransferase
LNGIVEQYDNISDDAVGILTTEDRDVWARSYEKMKQNPNNARVFDEIERGLFVVCLDQHFDYGKSAESAFGCQLLHGDGSKVNGGNRWFDKCLQFIVAPDGYSGMTYEHSPAEGPPIAALMDFAIDFVSKTDSTVDSPGQISDFEVLNFELDDVDRRAIRIAAQKFDISSSDIEMEIVRFKNYGKQFAKSQRVSPDSVVQLALQLAHFKMHKECPATYETGTLRRFHLGRTDTIRLPTMDSLKFCQKAVDDRVSDMEKSELFRKAVQSHKEYTAAACSGNGVDRHLLGLKLIALENGWPVPKFYSSKAYETAIHFKLSTSQVAAKTDAVLMFGPMYPDCYGICYNPQNNQINISVTSFKSFPGTSASEFAKTLEESFLEIRDFLTKGTKSKL